MMKYAEEGEPLESDEERYAVIVKTSMGGMINEKEPVRNTCGCGASGSWGSAAFSQQMSGRDIARKSTIPTNHHRELCSKADDAEKS
jgi:hypothetical protein